jgi:hypothetical protein
MDSYFGNAVTADIHRRFHVEGRNKPLALKTLREFEDRPSGIYVPPSVVIKRLEGVRIKRVAWKIVRGLYSHLNRQVLPEARRHGLDLVEPERKVVLAQWNPVLTAPSLGQYPGVFDYKNRQYAVAGNPARLDVWALLFWDRLMAFVMFHDHDCGCPQGDFHTG